MISEKDYNEIYLKGYEDGKNDNNNLKIHYEVKPSFTTRKIKELQQENQKYKEVIYKAIEYINKYAWQEDIIGGIYTTTGKPAIDRYMKLEWDNCNELLDILKEVSK